MRRHWSCGMDVKQKDLWALPYPPSTHPPTFLGSLFEYPHPYFSQKEKKMPVRMRLAMHGRRNARIFHLVVATATKARDAKPIETLGIFNPRPQPGASSKTVEWSVDRINYWLGVGAEPTKAAVRLLTLVCETPMHQCLAVFSLLTRWSSSIGRCYSQRLKIP